MEDRGMSKRYTKRYPDGYATARLYESHYEKAGISRMGFSARLNLYGEKACKYRLPGPDGSVWQRILSSCKDLLYHHHGMLKDQQWLIGYDQADLILPNVRE